jgi:Peptidase A4 family
VRLGVVISFLACSVAAAALGATLSLVGRNAPSPSLETHASPIWAGLIETGGPFRTVRGSWVVPAASKVRETTSLAYMWIGLGGVSDDQPLLQVGIAAETNTKKQVAYWPWYEVFPAPVTRPHFLRYPVRTGDRVQASIFKVNGRWQAKLRDVTQGWSFQLPVTYDVRAPRTAEWVEEDPTNARTNSLHTLMPVAPVTFTDISAGGPVTHDVLDTMVGMLTTTSMEPRYTARSDSVTVTQYHLGY